MNPFLRGILYGIDIAGASSLHEMLHLMKLPSHPMLMWEISIPLHHLPYLLGEL